MGTLPKLAILRGPHVQLRQSNEPLKIHRIFEHTIRSVSSLNNNNDKIQSIHGIIPNKGDACVIFENSQIDLQEINSTANQLARVILQELNGVQNGDGDYVIAVDMAPSINLITTLITIWKVGAAYLPLDAGFPDQRVHHMLKESCPSLVITEKNDSERYTGHLVMTFDSLLEISKSLSIADVRDDLTWSPAQGDSIAIILYTSGSSGVPKGVRIPHSVILNRLKWQWRTFPYSSTENVCLFKTALTFVDSVAELWGPLLWGKSLLIVKKADILKIDKFIELLDTYQIERLVLVPTLLNSILLYMGMQSNEKTPFRSTEKVPNKSRKLESLKLCVCSGETLTAPLAQKFYQYFSEDQHTLLNFYGSTEIMGDVLYYKVQATDDATFAEKIPIGIPVDNTNIYILDKQFRPVHNGEIGELFVSGLNLAAGYVSNREPEKFLDNPLAIDLAHRKMYRTGDFAFLAKGLIFYEGRTDSQIKIRGHKVDLSEVEMALRKLTQVEKSVVLCYKAGKIDQALLAFVTMRDDTVSSGSVEDDLVKILPPFMMPQVILIEHIPLLVNGKVDRQFLLKKYENDYKKGCSKEPDFDYTGVPSLYLSKARALYETVAMTLGPSLKGKINAATNYYSLGGNSLTSVLTVTKLRDMGYIISIGEFITSQSMLDVIMRMKDEESSQDISFEALSRIPEGKYTVEILNDEHKEDVISIITSSFYEKADLEHWIQPYINKSDYRELIEALWEPLVRAELSFAVKNKENETLAVCMNFDAHAEPEVKITSKLTIVFDFLEYLEAPFRDYLPMGTWQILHSFMMGTAATVPAHQNVELILFLEYENLKMARKKGFAGVFTTNTSPLTQQLGTDVFQYQVLQDYQINKYVATDGTKPFGEAPDSDRAVVSWKPLK